jgi:hypothetical protein
MTRHRTVEVAITSATTLAPAAPQGRLLASAPAHRSGLPATVPADPRLLSAAERRAAFGRVFAQAIVRWRARQASFHVTTIRTKQKRN